MKRKNVMDLKPVVNSIEVALAAVGLLATKVTIEDAGRDEHVMLDGWLSLTPVTLKKRSINGTIEVPGLQVCEWRSIPATRWEPEDVADHVMGDFQPLDAIRTAVLRLCEWYIDQALEADSPGVEFTED